MISETEMREKAKAATEATVNASVDRLRNPDEYRRTVLAMFGPTTGIWLLSQGASAVMDAASDLSERHCRVSLKNHHAYDMNAHLAAIALYRAAQERWNTPVIKAAE